MARGRPSCTPLTRRSFKNGSLQDDLAPWAEAVIKVARETGTPLLDLHASSVAAVQAMGARAATVDRGRAVRQRPLARLTPSPSATSRAASFSWTPRLPIRVGMGGAVVSSMPTRTELVVDDEIAVLLELADLEPHPQARRRGSGRLQHGIGILVAGP